MSALGEVAVNVRTNLRPLDRGFQQARVKSVSFDRSISKSTQGGQRAMRRLGVAASLAGKKIENIGLRSSIGFSRITANSNRTTSALTRLGVASRVAIGVLSALTIAVAGFGLAAQKGLSAFAPFEQAMRNVATVAGAVEIQFDALSDAALNASAVTRFNPQQTAQALYALASAGQSVTQQLSTLPNVLDFAEAAQARLGQSTEIVTSTMNVFSLSAMESARVADVYTAAIANSALNASRIEVAMRNAGPTAAALGQSFEQTTAALGLLTSAFGNGERAGTGLRAILTEMGDKAKAFGIKVKDSSGDFRPLLDILNDFEEKGVTSTQIIEQFGAEAGPSLAALLNQGSAALERMEGRLQSNGQAAETAAKQLDTLQGDLDSLSSAWSALMVELGDSIDVPARNVIQGMTDIVRSGRDGLDEINEAIQTTTDYWQALQDQLEIDLPNLENAGAFDALGPAREGISSDLVFIVNSFQLIANAAIDTQNVVIGAYVGGFDAVVAAWNALPAAFGDLAVRAANALISGISAAVAHVVNSINSIIIGVNLLGGSLQTIKFKGLPEIENKFVGAAGAAATLAANAFKAAQSVDYVGDTAKAVTKPVVDFLNNVDESASALRNSREEAKAWAVPIEAANDDLKSATASTKKFSGALNGAGGSAKKAGGSQSELNKQLEEYRSIIQRVAEEEMPWLRAAREADELREALEALIAAGEELPEEYVVAVRAKLDKLDRQVAAKSGEELGSDFGDAFQSGMGDLFKDIFEGGIESVDDFLDKVTSKFASLATDNIQSLFSPDAFSSLFGGGSNSSGGQGIDADPLAKIGQTVGTAAQGGGFFGGAAGASAALSGGGAGGAINAVAGATLGSFSLGFQSASPIMGGIGGALSGLSGGLQLGAALGLAAGPFAALGAVVGGALGFLGGIMGKNSKLKQKRLAAQKELAGELGAIDQLKQTSRGRGLGDFREDFTDYQDTSQKYQILARDAGNFDLQRELEEAHSEYFRLLETTFRNERDTAISNLKIGFGFDTAFFDAIDGMESARKELTGWVDDARFMFDRLRDFGNELDQNEVNSQIAEMEAAARDYAVSLVTGVEPMSDIAERMNEIKGAAVGLEQTLVALALTTEEAAIVTANAVAEAMNNLRDEYREGVQESINTLSDRGFVNELNDAIEQLNTNLADAALLSIDSGLALQQFDLALGQITKSAAESLPAAERAEVFRTALELVASETKATSDVLVSLLSNALTDLAEAAAEAAAALAEAGDDMFSGIRSSIATNSGIAFYGELEQALATYNNRLLAAKELGIEATGAMSELNASVKAVAANSNLTQAQLSALAEVFPALSDVLMGLIGSGDDTSLANAQNSVDQAKADLRSAYQAEVSAIEGNISQLKTFIERLDDLKTSLKLDSNLSPLSPKDQFLEAQRVFEETRAAAEQGDVEAIGRLEQVSRDYLNEARSYYGSSTGYFEIFEEVEQAIDQAVASAGTQITIGEQQLSALHDQVGALIDLNDSVVSVEDAILSLDTALSGLAVAQEAQVAAIYALAAIKDTQQVEQINSLYQSLLGRDADQAGLDGWQDILDNGGTIGGVAEGITNSREALIRNLYLSILGREPDPTGLAGFSQMLQAGASIDDITRMIVNSPEAHAMGITPMAGGGRVVGGIPGVDSVPILAMPEEFVMPRMQSRSYARELDQMRAGTFQSGESGDLVGEMRAMRQGIADLTSVVAQGSLETVDATNNLGSALSDVANRGVGLGRR